MVEDDNPDKVRGIVHNNSLVRLYLNAGPDASIEPAIRDVPVFPETKPLDDLLAELQRQRSSIGIVSDEYGRTVGIVTVEDILEEVVGEIEDETDARATSLRRLTDGDWYVRGHVPLGDLEDAGIELPVALRRLQLDRRLRLLRARPAAEARRQDAAPTATSCGSSRCATTGSSPCASTRSPAEHRARRRRERRRDEQPRSERAFGRAPGYVRAAA